MTPSRAVAIFTALALASAIDANAQSIQSLDGRWEGIMERDGAAMTVRFDFHTVAGTLTGRFTSETQRALEYPLDKVVYSDTTIRWELGGSLVFDGVVSPQAITGSFRARITFEQRSLSNRIIFRTAEY